MVDRRKLGDIVPRTPQLGRGRDVSYAIKVVAKTQKTYSVDKIRTLVSSPQH